MVFNTNTVTSEIRDESIKVAEDIFETLSHPDQMQATPANFNKLKSLSVDSILYEVSSDNKLAGWVVIMPTSKDLMNKFLMGEVGEQELLDRTLPKDHYSAVYLCAAATLPQYRRRGIALKLTKEALLRLPLENDYEIFAWPTSEEGKLALKKIETETGKVIYVKK